MIYMTEFTFPDIELEYSFLMGIKRTCYDTFYPFQTLSRHGLRRLDFEPITILYGGNGSGKTTALNVIAEKAGIRRESAYNRSNFFEDYTKMCGFETCGAIPKNSRIITSDDVFDFVLNLRSPRPATHTHTHTHTHKHTVAIFRHTRRGHWVQLHMIVSHRVWLLRIELKDLWKFSQCS